MTRRASHALRQQSQYCRARPQPDPPPSLPDASSPPEQRTIAAVYILRQARSNPHSVFLGVLCFIALSLPWQMYAYFTFHSLIPQSVVGKAVSHSAFEGVGWTYFVKYYQIYFPVGRLGRYAPAGIVASLALILWGVKTVWSKFPLLRPAGAFFLCFTAAFYLVVTLSLVLLTGWVGQISLAQAEFVGVGAFFTSMAETELH